MTTSGTSVDSSYFSLDDGEDLPILVDLTRQRDVVDFCPGLAEELVGRHYGRLVVETREPQGVILRPKGQFLPDPAGPSYVSVDVQIHVEPDPVGPNDAILITCRFDWDGRVHDLKVCIATRNRVQADFLDDVASLPLAEQGQVMFDHFFRQTIVEFIEEWTAQQKRSAAKAQRENELAFEQMYKSEYAKELERQNYQEVQRLKDEFSRQSDGLGLQRGTGLAHSGLRRISDLLKRKPP